MLPFKISPNTIEIPFSLKLYSVGCHHQHFMERAHGYSVHQLFICKKGKGTFVFKGNQKVTLKENEALILRKNVPHHYFPIEDSKWELAFLCFNESFPYIESLNLPTEEVFQLSSIENIYKIIETIWTYDHLELVSHRKTSTAIYDILLQLHELTTKIQSVQKSSKEQAKNIVEQVATFLNEHYSQTWTVEEISKHFGYSSQHLNRLFKSSHDCTVHNYLRKIRLERASTLLKEETSLKIERIAEQIGMDTGYFIRVFQSIYEETPGNYRKKYLSNP